MKTLRYLPIFLILFWACSKDNDPAPANTENKDDSTYVVLVISGPNDIKNLSYKFIKRSNSTDTIRTVWTNTILQNSKNYDKDNRVFYDTLWIYKGISQVVSVSIGRSQFSPGTVQLGIGKLPNMNVTLFNQTLREGPNIPNSQTNIVHNFTFKID